MEQKGRLHLIRHPESSLNLAFRELRETGRVPKTAVLDEVAGLTCNGVVQAISKANEIAEVEQHTPAGKVLLLTSDILRAVIMATLVEERLNRSRHPDEHVQVYKLPELRERAQGLLCLGVGARFPELEARIIGVHGLEQKGARRLVYEQPISEPTPREMEIAAELGRFARVDIQGESSIDMIPRIQEMGRIVEWLFAQGYTDIYAITHYHYIWATRMGLLGITPEELVVMMDQEKKTGATLGNVSETIYEWTPDNGWELPEENWNIPLRRCIN